MKVHLENWSLSLDGKYRSIIGAATQEQDFDNLDCLFGYDGVLVCESVVSKEHAELISIAPSMLRLLLAIEMMNNKGLLSDQYYQKQIIERAIFLLNEFRTRITTEVKLLPLPGQI